MWECYCTKKMIICISPAKQPTIPYSLGTRGVHLALGSIQCFIIVSIAPEPSDSKSARCQAVTLGEVELFTSIQS